MCMCRVFSCVVGRGCLLWPPWKNSWQNSISLWPASFCTPRPNLPVTPGVSWLPNFAFQSSIMKRTSTVIGGYKCHTWISLEPHNVSIFKVFVAFVGNGDPCTLRWACPSGRGTAVFSVARICRMHTVNRHAHGRVYKITRKPVLHKGYGMQIVQKKNSRLKWRRIGAGDGYAGRRV